MKLINLQCSEDLKFKFLACNIFDFEKMILRPYNPHPASSEHVY